MPDLSTEKDFDAIPSIAYAVRAYSQSNKEGYDKAINHIKEWYGKDTAARVHNLNVRLKERGGSGVDAALLNISKSNIVKGEGNKYLKNFFVMVQENPDLLNKYQYAFEVKDEKKPWTQDLTADIEKHGDKDVIVPHKMDIPFNVVIHGEKRKIIPKGVDISSIDIDKLPDLHTTDYQANLEAIKQ